MRQQSSTARIAELLAQLVVEIRGATALGLTDINKFSEDCLVPVLRSALALPRLRNLNKSEKQNFPAVDLADDEAETAIQVTASPSRAKVMNTLKKFVDHGLDTRFRRLLVYVITEKQEHYSPSGVDEILGGRIDFDINRDVMDYRSVLQSLQERPVEALGSVQCALEKQLARSQDWGSVNESAVQPAETAFLNLVRVAFPSTLYVADIVFEEEGRQSRRGSRRRSNLRDRVRNLMEDRDIRFSADWTCHEDQLISFHDLGDNMLPISEIVDRGTVTALGPDEYYGASEDQERVFKSLLHNCLKQAIYKRGVQWQHRHDMFIFLPLEDGQAKRQETWGSGTTRTVYEKKMNKKDPTKVFCHKHLAFRRQFIRLGDDWFVAIKPDWFFSFDGYKRSRYADKSVTWLKKREWNGEVFTHLRFLVDFLTALPEEDLFEGEPPAPYPFLQLGELVCLTGLPALPDREWLMAEAAEKVKKIKGSQTEFQFR